MSGVRYTRQERLAQINHRLAKGWTHRMIADDLGISRRAVRDTLCDPTGEKKRARFLRYRGVCVDCGGPTDGGDGRAKASERCLPCRMVYQRGQKVWTREAIIEAIERWAAEHDGKPPTSTQWIRAGEHHPARSNVYRTRTRPSKNNPFASWADAIEAAGFPRPTYVYERTPEIRARMSRSQRARQARQRSAA